MCGLASIDFFQTFWQFSKAFAVFPPIAPCFLESAFSTSRTFSDKSRSRAIIPGPKDD